MAISGDGASVSLTHAQRKLAWESYLDEMWAWDACERDSEMFKELVELKLYVGMDTFRKSLVPELAGCG